MAKARPRPASLHPRRPGFATPQVRHGCMDWTEFRDWALAIRGSALATTTYNVGRLRSLERQGLDVALFLSSPTAAQEEGVRVVSKLKSAGKKGHATRTYQKALNWLVAYARYLHPGQVFADLPLDPEPPSERATVADERVPELWCYRCGDAYVEKFRRAVAWAAYWTRLRRSEVSRLRKDRDGMDQDNQVVRVLQTAKRGAPREVVVPWFFWDDGFPMAEYLAVRLDVPDSNALFTLPDLRRGHGRARVASSKDVYEHLRAMGRDLGFRLNFIRTRRSSSTALDVHGAHPRVGAHQLGQSSSAKFEHYTGSVTTERARHELQRVAPGVYLSPGDRPAARPGSLVYRGPPSRAPPGAGDGAGGGAADSAQIPPASPGAAECPVCLRPLPPATVKTTPAVLSSRPDSSPSSGLAGSATSSPHSPKFPGVKPMEPLIVKKGSLSELPTPVTELTLEANVVPGAPIAVGNPGRAARMGGAREPGEAPGPAREASPVGAFTRTSRVAPDGARPSGVVPRYPATRQVTRHPVRPVSPHRRPAGPKNHRFPAGGE